VSYVLFTERNCLYIFIGSWFRHTIWVIVRIASQTYRVLHASLTISLFSKHGILNAHDYIYIGLPIATHAKRILELRAAYRLVLVDITFLFLIVHHNDSG